MVSFRRPPNMGTLNKKTDPLGLLGWELDAQVRHLLLATREPPACFEALRRAASARELAMAKRIEMGGKWCPDAEFDIDPNGYGSKLNNKGTAGFSPCFHLPGFHFGYLLTHSQMSLQIISFSEPCACVVLPIASMGILRTAFPRANVADLRMPCRVEAIGR